MNNYKVDMWKDICLKWGTKYGEVCELLNKYKGLFDRKSRVAENFTHKLKLKDIKTFKGKSYPIPYKHKNDVKMTLE